MHIGRIRALGSNNSMADQPDGDDVAEAMNILRDMKLKSDTLELTVKNLINRVEEGELDTNEGLTFLEVKNHLMLEYLIDITQIGLLKCQGLSIQQNPAIDRLIENRTFLEKMKPIEKKLQYQIDKLVKAAVTGIDENDPLRLKPNPDNLMSKLDDESGSGSEEGDGEKPKKYVPPKLAPVYYEGDETMAEKEERERKRQKSRALSSSIMQELRQEYYEGPEEIRDDMNLHRLRANKREKERIEYEEEKFFRMAISKKEKAAARRMATMSGLSEITHGFGDISALSEDAPGAGGSAKKRKRSSKAKGKGKKSGKKKFKR